MGSQRREYTPEYKDEAVKLVVNTGRAVAVVARELGIKEQTLGRWVNLYKSRQDAGDGCRIHSRHGRVDADPVAQRCGGRHPAVVDRAGEPGGCLGVVVLQERRELGPALRALQENGLAHIDAAESGDERQRDDTERREKVGEGGQGCCGVGAHRSIMVPRALAARQ